MNAHHDNEATARVWAEIERFSGWVTATVDKGDLRAALAEAPPTAAEVLAHVEAGGEVEMWCCLVQSWDTDEHVWDWIEDAHGLTPQPGLRLVRGSDAAALGGET